MGSFILKGLTVHHESVFVILDKSKFEAVVDGISAKVKVSGERVIGRLVNGKIGIIKVPETGEIAYIVWQLSLSLFEYIIPYCYAEVC